MRKFLRRRLHNADLKVAALVLAVVTWYYLATAGIEERRFARVPVRILGLSKDVALLSLGTRDVTVKLKGPRGSLDVLEGRTLVVEVNLRDVAVELGQPLDRSVRIGPSLVRVGAGGDRTTPLLADVSFLDAEPGVVQMTLDRMTRRDVPIQAEFEGEPAPGFELRPPAVSPATVSVRGPHSLLKNLSSLSTERIRIGGITEGRKVEARLLTEARTPEFGTVPIFPAQQSVAVTLTVTEKPDERTIERVPVRLVALPPSLAVIQQDVAEATVRLRGPRQRLRDLDAQSLVAEVGLEGETAPGRTPEPKSFFLLRENIRHVVERGVSLPLAVGVELLAVEPNTVQVTLDRLRTRTLPVKAVLDGRPAEDYEVGDVAVVPATATVRGPQSVVGKLEAIETQPVAVGGAAERLRRTVRLVERVDAGDFRGVSIDPSPRLVDVVVAVTERTARKTLKALPIHVVVEAEKLGGFRVSMRPRTVAAVTLVGPQSRMAAVGPDNVTAFVRLQITSVADLRPTIRTVEFNIRDPKVRLAPDSKPITVNIEFPPPEAPPAPPKPRRTPKGGTAPDGG